jgi:Bucentaur or craniofacial development
MSSSPTKESLSGGIKGSSSSNSQVDAAFERCFGFRWGEPLDVGNEKDINYDGDNAAAKTQSNTKKKVLYQQLTDIFGSRRTASRILRLYDVSQSSSFGNNRQKRSINVEDNSISVLNRMTKRIKTNISTETSSISSSLGIKSKTPIVTSYEKTLISKEDYMNLPLPASVVVAEEAKQQQSMQVDVVAMLSTTVSEAAASAAPTAAKNNSNLDNVLKQLAGPKKLNTVEKTSGDWEGFKSTDKQLQDELERTAQSKDAFLVKQDFLDRVDQRRFELERDERDQERARRQLSSASSQK